jgi:transposase
MDTQDLLLRRIDRNQMVMSTVDVERLVEEDHPARMIWETVGKLNLSAFYEGIGSNSNSGGRPSYDPHMLISVWVYAYSRGIGSAREVERRCEYEPAFQWLTGMEGVNHHSLSDFRVQKREELDELFTQLLGVLSAQGLIRLEQVMVDGTKIKANASGKSFRREKTLEEHLQEAKKQVKALQDPEGEELSQQQQKARERGAREKQRRLEQALQELQKQQEQKKSVEEKAEVRVSETDPEARKMKQSEGGSASSYNAQICTDSQEGFIVDADVTQAGNDYQQLLPAMNRVEERMGQAPDQGVADAGYTSHANVEAMAVREIDFLGRLSADERKANGSAERFAAHVFVYDSERNCFICPGEKVLRYESKQEKDGQIQYKYKAHKSDCDPCPLRPRCCGKNKRHGRSVVRREESAAMAAFRAKMASEEAQQQYRKRAQVAEFPNAWIKAKLGLRQFHVRGLLKVKAELLWACFTFNLQTWLRCQKRCALASGMTAA